MITPITPDQGRTRPKKRGGPRNDIWPTPDWLFGHYHRRFRFELDAAADRSNAKCARFYSVKENGLLQPWNARAVWCNPPYGGKNGLPGTDVWVEKGRREAELRGNTVAMHVPVKADTAWWDEQVWGRNRVIRSWRAELAPGEHARMYLLDEGPMLVEVAEHIGRVSYGGGNGWFASATVVYGVRR